MFLKETNKKDLSKVNEEFKIENDDSLNKAEIEKKIDSQKVETEKLDKKEVKPKPQKKTKVIKEKVESEDVEENLSDPRDAIQTILELHQGLEDISRKNSNILNATTRLINKTYYTERMLNMIIGDSWKNVNNQTKKKMIDVFEEYIAKNYIKKVFKNQISEIY